LPFILPAYALLAQTTKHIKPYTVGHDSMPAVPSCGGSSG